ncbi:hypothetical protein MCUN1_000211 [Malassezia cuniculi]|uniref:Proteasome maturation factor UMP1 n=1 Tax=Malassezia cuniculi TaxID=948313 RepID=A0AAF0EVH7_9BASI|nr:hypothetical protein MCUN1_000211 [Malassezia cuniculi]
MHIVPAPMRSHDQTSQASTAHPETGAHDAMRHGLRSIRAETAAASTHPLEHRLENWDATQRAWRQQIHRDTFGIAMPLRTSMERRIAGHTNHFPARAVAAVHLDVLDGRDESLEPVDFLPSGIALGGSYDDIHAPMERKLRL